MGSLIGPRFQRWFHRALYLWVLVRLCMDSFGFLGFVQLNASLSSISADEFLGLLNYNNNKNGNSTGSVKDNIVTMVAKNNTKPASILPYPVHFITYADEKLNTTRVRFVRQAERSGWFHSVKGYGPSDLPNEFQVKFKDILALPRGAGYWIWRFPIMELAMSQVPFGEYIAFIDAGCRLNPNGKHYLLSFLDALNKSKEYDEFSCRMNHLQEHVWTSKRVFDAFNISMNSSIATSGQDSGGLLLFRNGNQVRKILKSIYEVLDQDPFLITDKYNAESKKWDPAFRENRHDQSLHSIARKIHGSVVFECPDNRRHPFHVAYLKRMNWDQVVKMEEEEFNSTITW